MSPGVLCCPGLTEVDDLGKMSGLDQCVHGQETIMTTDYTKMTQEQKEQKAATDKDWRKRNRKRKNETDKAWRLRSRKKELARKRKQNADRDRTDTGRVCRVCSGPISDRNVSGICAKNYECRVAQQARRNAGKPTGRKKGDSLYLLPIVYDLDNGEEIIDEVAVQIAFEGNRKVGLTTTERKMVMARMIRAGYQYREIADHIGTSPAMLKPVFEEMGYQIIPRRTPGSGGREATEIRKVDRTRSG